MFSKGLTSKEIMSFLNVCLQIVFLITMCCAENVDLMRIFGGSRVKRHTMLDQSKVCKAFGCLNGFCKESEMRKYRIVCECFPGYQGRLCDRLKCPFSCGNHGTCARNGRTLFCQCDTGYRGPRCESPDTAVHPAHSIVPQSVMKALNRRVKGEIINVNGGGSWFANAVTPKDIKFSEFHSHAVIDTNVKPDVCAPGFQCYHGICDRKSMLYGQFQCLCNDNYTGLFCEKKCTLNCKNGGQCYVKIDGHQVCICPFDYNGYYCEKPTREGRSIV